jgi:hypothetical protein
MNCILLINARNNVMSQINCNKSKAFFLNIYDRNGILEKNYVQSYIILLKSIVKIIKGLSFYGI